MFKNIFTQRAKEAQRVDFTIATEESIENNFSEDSLQEFIMFQDASMTRAVLENARFMYIGERDNIPEIVQESASDFLDKVVEFFKKLIQKVKEWFGKIFLLIQTLIGNTGKMLESNRDLFLKKNVTFNMTGFEYTIKEGAPKLDHLDKLISEYNKDIVKIKEFKPQDINDRRDEHKGSLSKIRGEILTDGESIDAENFKEHCDAFFRNGDTESTVINIDSAYIRRISDNYNRIKKLYSDSVKEKRKLEVQLESLKKFFENGARQVKYDSNGEKTITAHQIEKGDYGVKTSGDGTQYTAAAGNLKLMNMYFNYRYEQSKDISNIMLTVMESKVKALKEEIKFYDACVRKWIVASNNKNEDDDSENKTSKSKGGDK